MTHTYTAIKMILDRWNASLKNFDKLLAELTDQDLLKEVAPGKNRGIYLLGHMIAAHDDIFVLLGIGDRLYPQLNEPFLKLADKVATDLPSIRDLRSYWVEQCRALSEKLSALDTEHWFEKHTAVSSEDFAKEPHRNKLNIILTRTTHLQYHIGQLILLKSNNVEQ